MRACHYCKIEEKAGADLRPYGPDGALVCYSCATQSPEREKGIKDRYLKLLTDAGSGAVLTPDGPKALK